MKKQEIRELTRAEEQVMHVLWEIGKGFVKDVLEYMPEPRPAYNTISTILRILESKGFVAHEAFGKSHRYYPLIDKRRYTRFATNNLLSGYFGGSVSNMLSFFAREQKLTVQELDALLKQLKSDDHD